MNPSPVFLAEAPTPAPQDQDWEPMPFHQWLEVTEDIESSEYPALLAWYRSQGMPLEATMSPSRFDDLIDAYDQRIEHSSAVQLVLAQSPEERAEDRSEEAEAKRLKSLPFVQATLAARPDPCRPTRALDTARYRVAWSEGLDHRFHAMPAGNPVSLCGERIVDASDALGEHDASQRWVSRCRVCHTLVSPQKSDAPGKGLRTFRYGIRDPYTSRMQNKLRKPGKLPSTSAFEPVQDRTAFFADIEQYAFLDIRPTRFMIEGTTALVFADRGHVAACDFVATMGEVFKRLPAGAPNIQWIEILLPIDDPDLFDAWIEENAVPYRQALEERVRTKSQQKKRNRKKAA